MIFAREMDFDWSNQPSSCYEIRVFNTPFGLWISEINTKGYMLSLKPYRPHPHDIDPYIPLPFHDIPSKAKPIGTPFQLSVWKALTQIPHYSTSHYSGVASAIHNPLAVRAVGTAIGRNPIIGFIPCHRVLAKDGSIGGFSCGLELKEQLLGYENEHCAA
ncbi:MAG: MGMT family protein [Pseudomonadota bacterium]